MAERREPSKNRKNKITYGLIVAILIIIGFFLYYFGNFTAVNGS